jgi:hypothetical protein
MLPGLLTISGPVITFTPVATTDEVAAHIVPGRSREVALLRSPAVWLGASITLLLLLVQAGEVNDADGSSVLAVAHSIVAHAGLAIPHAEEGHLGVNGSYFSVHGLGLSIISVPGTALAVFLGHFVHHESALEGLFASSLMPLIGGLIAVEVFRISRRIGGTTKWSVLVAAGTIFGTYLLPYVSKVFFSEPLACLTLLWAIDALLHERRGWASVALGVAVLTRFECVLVVPFFLVIDYMQSRDRLGGFDRALRALTISIGAITAVGVTAAYNAYRFGSVASTGYPSGQHFTVKAVPSALHGFFFSSNKNIFIFAPILLVVLWALIRLRGRGQTGRLAFWLLTCNFLAALIAASLWSAWAGDWAWGPRLLLPGAVPLICSVGCLGGRIERIVAAVAFGAGALVSASILIVSTQYQQLVGASSPTIGGQYRAIPVVVSYTAHHFHKAGLGPGTGASRHFVLIWQVGVVRELGNDGVGIAALGSLLLLATVAVTLNRLRVACSSSSSTDLPSG